MSKDTTYGDLLKSINESRDSSIVKISVMLSDVRIVKTSFGYTFCFKDVYITCNLDFDEIFYNTAAGKTLYSQKEHELLKPILRKSVFMHTFIK